MAGARERGGAAPFRPEHFAREDMEDDAAFYAFPRLVTHIDEAAVSALGAFYAQILPEAGDVLDLMSSCVSHLPETGRYRSVVGLGMNADELAANPRLTRRIVHDLNVDPVLPFADATFDSCLIAVSVQYLTRPLEVFAEIARVLKPDAGGIVSFSNRMFPTKAVALWRALGDEDRARLVALYFLHAGGFEDPVFADLSPAPGVSDPLFVVMAKRHG